MSEIIPAILPKDFEDLEEKLGMVAGKVPMVHIDVTNGTMTETSNWPYSGDMREFLKIVEEVDGFPYWEDLGFEVHLMVNNATLLIEDWIKAGAERLIIQYESFEDKDELKRLMALLKNNFSAGSTHLGVELGLAVNMETQIDEVLEYVLNADFIHLMSIDEIGEQGHAFDEKIYERIKALKEKHPDTIISIDGGINLDNAKSLIEAGASRLIVGSAIFGKDDPEEALLDFLDIEYEQI